VNLVLYSAVYGAYEATPKKLPADLEIPAIMFTDSEDFAARAREVGWLGVVNADVYDVVDAGLRPENGDVAITRPMLAHKWFKTHPLESMTVAPGFGFQGVEASVWMDGSMEINCSGPEFVDRQVAALGSDDWSAMSHPWRRCIYDEERYTAAVCWGRYSVEAMARQVAHYRSLGHPEGWGLFATGHCVRRHTAAVAQLSEVWWQDNLIWSHQDQLSLPVRMRHDAAAGWIRYNTDLPWAGSWELYVHGQ
jgi:hypothetical protein